MNLCGKFDLVVGSGVFLDGHIPNAGFDDAHAMLKTGGYFVTSIRQSYYVDGEEHGYKDKLDEMIRLGEFSPILKSWVFMRGVKDAEDPIFAEMPSFMFVVKKTN